MEKTHKYLIMSLILLTIVSCGRGSKTNVPAAKPLPLNISIYLDLSNRLLTKNQPANDKAIVLHFADLFIQKAEADKIIPCKDRISIFFYPDPDLPDINELSQNLSLDLGTTQVKEKKVKLKNLHSSWDSTLTKIYDTTIENKRWIGSDIYGFFSENVKNYCVKDGYRNILIILTDGYIYDVHNKIISGDESTYISVKTLANPKSRLSVPRKDLSDLEVLMLEVNAQPGTDLPKMKDVISTWFKEMGVNKYEVLKSDLPSRTSGSIDKFMNCQ
jgi:hypothetical protein